MGIKTKARSSSLLASLLSAFVSYLRSLVLIISNDPNTRTRINPPIAPVAGTGPGVLVGVGVPTGIVGVLVMVKVGVRVGVRLGVAETEGLEVGVTVGVAVATIGAQKPL